MNLTELLDKHGFPTLNKSEDEMMALLDGLLTDHRYYLDREVEERELKDYHLNLINEVINDYEEDQVASLKELLTLLSEWGAKISLNDKNMLDREFWDTYHRIISRYELPDFLNDGKGHLLNLIRDLAMSNKQLNFQLLREQEKLKDKDKTFKMFLYFVSECLENGGLTHVERNGVMKLLESRIKAFNQLLDCDGDEF